ncbi:hypothetical protein [Pseudomonas sp. S09G 359]|jgi:hypothetical protein|uniref:hypothetical protein n=1 Tax=Pseudomonas sp. S09G 359 TaxID=2054919 RepID=UPI000C6C9E7B|nr:hypothetical protein [Pseudomonas sp. S09G 359]AUG08471.1 hypothetical protein CXQ82_18460 [Pseudomonas sp. S09G 359]
MIALWMIPTSLPERRQPVTQTCGVLLLLFSLNGCAQNQTFTPAPDGGQVSITVKVPQNLAAEPMRVMYRSEKCPIKRSGPDWSTYEEDGYLSITVHPLQQGQSDLYEAKLPINGSGTCQWRLSNVTFGVTYASTTHFGENVKAGSGGGVIVMFDQRLPQRRSVFQPTIEVSGDVLIKGDYYPWITEQFIGGHELLAWIVGEGEMYSYYRALSAKRVTFEPVLHADYVVYSVESKVQKVGNYPLITYPDGSTAATGHKPKFKKLQTIRLGQSQ